jgi:hypothetical protein
LRSEPGRVLSFPCHLAREFVREGRALSLASRLAHVLDSMGWHTGINYDDRCAPEYGFVRTAS